MMAGMRLNWLVLPSLAPVGGIDPPKPGRAPERRLTSALAALGTQMVAAGDGGLAPGRDGRAVEGGAFHLHAAAKPTTKTGEPLLQVRGLGKAFGGLQAVQELDFEVYPGEIVAMIGPNGAGKTTVFNMLTATYRPSNGVMTFRGRDLGKLAPHQVTRLGLVRTFQNLKLFNNMSALDNVKVGRYCRTRSGLAAAIANLPWTKKEEHEIEERAMGTLEFVGLGNQAFELAKSLPYGDQKLLEIARALATDPTMILLDEPAAGLNSSESAELVKLVRKIRADGVTVMLIEHDMKVVMSISERIVVLDHGEQIAEGTPAQICADQRVIDAYLGKAV